MHDLDCFKERREVNDPEYLAMRRVTDRRKFCYTAHSPERRSGMDRRKQDAGKFKGKVA